MDRVNLTPDRIRKAACPPDKQQVFLWDKESPRLGVRITAGSKSFVFETKIHRKTFRQTIGSCSAWAVDDARREANRLQSLIDQGIDPRDLEREKQAQKIAEKTAQDAAQREAEDRRKFTLRALCEAYVVHLEGKGKTKSAKAAQSAFKCHVLESGIADTPAREVTARQIAEIVRQVAEQGKGRTAGVLRSYLSAAFGAAKKAPYDSRLPAALIAYNIEQNPVDPVATIPVKSGYRTLSADELKVYLSALGDDLTDRALKVALYAGGQRMAQLLRAKVADYDQTAKTLRLFDGKGNRPEPRAHLLPLGPVAAGIITELVKQADASKSAMIFSSHRGKVHESNPGKRCHEISQSMGGEPFDLRDVRRTCETMLAGLGISRDIRAQLLSHGISGVQATHYDRHTYLEEKRAALAKWERHLARLGEKGGRKVVNLK